MPIKDTAKVKAFAVIYFYPKQQTREKTANVICQQTPSKVIKGNVIYCSACPDKLTVTSNVQKCAGDDGWERMENTTM